MAINDFSFNATPEVLSVFLVGALVEIPLPPSYPDVPDMLKFQPGTYFVDAVVIHADKSVEIGIADEKTHEHIDYFSPRELLKIRVSAPGVFIL